ncbi:MAG: hypothetical protein WCK18_10795 [Prolixibacteraceae bacterium]
MGKRLFIIITILLIAGMAAGWYFFVRESKYFGTSPIKAVPVESPFFIRIRNLGDFATKTVRNPGWQSMRNIREVSSLYRNLVFIDSLKNAKNKSGDFLSQKEILMVPMDSSRLYLIEIGSISEKNGINTFIKSYFQSRNILPSTKILRNVPVQCYKWDENGERMEVLVTFYRGLLLAGNDSSSLVKAIVQLDQPSLLEDPGYQRVKKNATENADLNLYINHQTLPEYLDRYYHISNSAEPFLHHYARWTEVDVIQKSNQLMINGYSVPDSSLSSYLDAFRNQKSMPGTLTKYMPATTSFFVSQNFSNPAQYLKDYRNYLQKYGQSDEYGYRLSELSKTLDLNVGQYLNEGWSGEAAALFTNLNQERVQDNRFLLLKVRSGANDPLVAAIKKWSVSSCKEIGDPGLEEAARNNVWRVPLLNFGNLIGSLCFGSIDTRWMTAGDGFILMGSTPGSLKRYLNLLQRGELLQDAPAFSSFTAGLARSCNFFLWSRPGLSLPFFKNNLVSERFPDIQKESSGLIKLDNLAWQWGFENGMVYNTASLHVNPDAVPENIPFWRVPVRTPLKTVPVFVSFSPKNLQKDLVFQDADNNLIDLDADGSEQWKIHLKGSVMGEIKLIDYRKNGDLQLLFNTEEAIHLIGKNGVEIRNFPVKLRSGATNEVTVADYDGKKDYRYLIACKDRKIYNFDKNGKPVTGWQPGPAAARVEQPVRYFKSGTRDYLVYSDWNRTYILDRQGKERVKLKNDFVHSGNGISLIKKEGKSSYMITTDDHGKLRRIGFDGSVQKVNTGNFSSGHFFLPVDFNGDGNFQFLFSDQQAISLFDESGKEIFTKSLNLRIDHLPNLITFNGEKLIRLTSEAENKTFLVRKDGTLFNNLLPSNCFLEAIGIFNSGTGVCNIIAGTKEGYLSNFQRTLNE